MNKKIITVSAAAAVILAGLATALWLITGGSGRDKSVDIKLYMYNTVNGSFSEKTADVALSENAEDAVSNAAALLSELCVKVNSVPLAPVNSVSISDKTANIDFDKSFFSGNTHRDVAFAYCIIKSVGGLSQTYKDIEAVRVSVAGEPVRDETEQIIGAYRSEDINIASGENVFASAQSKKAE